MHSSRNNQLKSLPPELSQCGEIRDLVISFNHFPAVPPVIYQLKKLEHIIADGNQVYIHSMLITSWIVSVWLYTNILLIRSPSPQIACSFTSSLQISSIDVEGLRQLPAIQTLDLQNNSIALVPPQLGTITTLKSVQHCNIIYNIVTYNVNVLRHIIILYIIIIIIHTLSITSLSECFDI